MHLVCLLCSAAVIFISFQNIFISLKDSHIPLAVTLHPLPTNPLCASVDLPVLDISYTWTYALCGLWCLASLTEHPVFKVRLHCSKCHCSFFFIWLSNSPWCRWTTLFFSIHPLMDIWVISIFCLLWLVLQ